MTGPDRDLTRGLYPFLHPDEGGPDPATLDAVLDQAVRSTLRKAEDVAALRRRLIDEYEEAIPAAARAMAERFEEGGRLLAFGNGGSATDAADAVADCVAPPYPDWRPIPALALTADAAVVTAVANDVGFENVFVRQVIAFGRRGDVALGFSTSGGSPNVLRALERAKRNGLLTVALAGYDGGALAASPAVDHCFVARLDYVPRIQEGHATVWHTLLELVQACLADAAGGSR